MTARTWVVAVWARPGDVFHEAISSHSGPIHTGKYWGSPNPISFRDIGSLRSNGCSGLGLNFGPLGGVTGCEPRDPAKSPSSPEVSRVSLQSTLSGGVESKDGTQHGEPGPPLADRAVWRIHRQVIDRIDACSLPRDANTADTCPTAIPS